MKTTTVKTFCPDKKCAHPMYTHHVGGCTASVRQGCCYVPCKCAKTRADVEGPFSLSRALWDSSIDKRLGE